jgi:hypothetical protein
VTNATSPISEEKACGRVIRWLARLTETAGDRLFAAPDQVAVHHGWQITARRGGLGRCYRDARFDAPHPYARPNGSGETDGEPCPTSASTGRVSRPASCQEGRFP